MSEPAIKAALVAAGRVANSEWDDAFITPAHTACIVAAFLRALPYYQMKRRTGVRPARYDIEATSTVRIAAALRALAEEAGDE